MPRKYVDSIPPSLMVNIERVRIIEYTKLRGKLNILATQFWQPGFLLYNFVEIYPWLRNRHEVPSPFSTLLDLPQSIES